MIEPKAQNWEIFAWEIAYFFLQISWCCRSAWMPELGCDSRLTLGLACLDNIGHSLLFQECLKWKVEWWHCVQTAEHLRNHLSSKFYLSWKLMKIICILCCFESSCKAHFVKPLVQICAFLVACSSITSELLGLDEAVQGNPNWGDPISSRLHAIDQLPRLPRWVVWM